MRIDERERERLASWRDVNYGMDAAVHFVGEKRTASRVLHRAPRRAEVAGNEQRPFLAVRGIGEAREAVVREV